MAAVITQQPTGIRPSPSINHLPTPLGIHRCARINSLRPPDVSAATVIAIYVAAGFDRSGSLKNGGGTAITECLNNTPPPWCIENNMK
eukprot:scaffold36803_cov45-Cyclotella_meneghiniana.AAC.2